MSFQELTLQAKDGYPLAIRIYEAEEPKAVVKCIHGMQEHQDRYRAFAEALQAEGYTVVTADLRGHGPNAPSLSHIADEDGHLLLMDDEETILHRIHERWAGVPVVLFGHSMGTIIARVFLQKWSREFHKVVLSGYPNPNSAAGAGILLTNLLSSFKGADGYSKMVDGMVLGPFAKAVPDAKTPVDWLSVNPENVARYIEDPLCGVRFTLGSYSALFHMIALMNKAEKYEEPWKELPILLISGQDDPCTGGEKGRKDSEEVLRKAGFRELEIVTLEGMRHEILNEDGRDRVTRIIIDFLDRQ